MTENENRIDTLNRTRRRGNLVNRNSLGKKHAPIDCPHGEVRLLCLKCAGLSEGQIRQWDRLRTRERHISPCGKRSYSHTKISGGDRVLTSSILDLYYCLDCDDTFRTDELTTTKSCPMCGELLRSSDEFFQTTGFSSLLGSTTGSRDVSTVAAFGANSGVQKACIGRIRTPLEAARDNRANPPGWLYDRQSFLKTLKDKRALRGEQILVEFYVNKETDTQIADALHWTKDAVKKERKDLVKRGNKFFSTIGYPPSPAFIEGDKNEE
jgi:hypothetical protein